MSATENGEIEITLDLHQRPREELTQQLLGFAVPYVLLKPKDVTGDNFEVSVEAGGGAQLLDVADFLEAIAEALRAPQTVQSLTEAIEAEQKEQG